MRFRTGLWAWGWVALMAACPMAGAAGYDPAADSLVNPPALGEPAPADPARIAGDDVLIRHLRAEPATLNPVFMVSGHELAVREMLFDEPVVFGPQLEWRLNPAMVEGYTESADHLSGELKLKPGLQWHDGQPLTAEDIAFSWRVILDDRVPVSQTRKGVERVADCTAVDALTVRYRFAEPLATNAWGLKFPVLPRHIYEKGMTDDPTLKQSDSYVRANRNPVGNGSFRFVEWKAGDRIVLERWGDYSGSKARFARVVFRIVPDANVALMMLKRGELDEMSLTPQQFSAQTRDERFAGVGVKGWAAQTTLYCLAWNLDGTNSFFSDVRVRRAMGHAVNLPLICATVYDGLFSACAGIFPPGSAGHDPDLRPLAYDLRQAGELLEAAGWRIDPGDGWRYHETGGDGRTKFEFSLAYAQESKTSPQVAAILKEDLRRLGVELKPLGMEYTALRERVFMHNFQAVMWAWTATGESDDARDLFHSEARAGGQNFVGYSNPAVDALFAQARRSFDPKERAECYRRIGRIVQEDAPYTLMLRAPSLWAFHKRIRGVVFSPMGPSGFYPGVRDWWVPAGQAIRGER